MYHLNTFYLRKKTLNMFCSNIVFLICVDNFEKPIRSIGLKFKKFKIKKNVNMLFSTLMAIIEIRIIFFLSKNDEKSKNFETLFFKRPPFC